MMAEIQAMMTMIGGARIANAVPMSPLVAMVNTKTNGAPRKKASAMDAQRQDS